MIRIGLIGLGNISGVHLTGYNNLLKEQANISLEAFCDKDAKKLKDRPGRLYTSLEEFLQAERGKLDMVDICLPTYLHASAAIRAMECGFHVLVEKPMALSPGDAQNMCAVASRTGRTLMVAQCLRFSDEVEAIRRYVREGIFGKPKTADVRRDFGGGTLSEDRAWFHTEALSGGALMDVHIHDIDWMQYVFGVPAGVSTGAKKVYPGSGYDIVSTQYNYADGFFAHCSGEWTTPHNPYANVQQMVKFERGFLLHTSFDGGSVFRAVGADGAVTELTPVHPHDMYTEEIRYFIHCISAGEPVTRCLPESTAESVRIAAAEIASADRCGAQICL